MYAYAYTYIYIHVAQIQRLIDMDWCDIPIGLNQNPNSTEKSVSKNEKLQNEVISHKSGNSN